MPHIVLTADQVRILERATAPVEIRDESGRVVGQVAAPTDEQIVGRIQRDRAAKVARYPAEQVEDRLRRLEAIRQQQGMDDSTMRELLRRMRTGEEV